MFWSYIYLDMTHLISCGLLLLQIKGDLLLKTPPAGHRLHRLWIRGSEVHSITTVDAPMNFPVHWKSTLNSFFFD
jgi:hypothetical protein